MSLHKAFLLDLADEIQHLLRAAYRKRGNDHIAASVEGPLDHIRKGTGVIRMLRSLVGPVAVGRFHDHIVRTLQIDRIRDQRLVGIADISGEDDLLRHTVLRDRHFDGTRSEKMAGVYEPDGDPFCYDLFLLILHAYKALDRVLRVDPGIERLHLRPARALCLPVLPLCFKFLYVRGIKKHDAAQRCRPAGGEDLSLESLLAQERQKARVVHVGVRQQNHVDLRSRYRHGRIFIQILTLLHTVIDQNLLPARFKIITASRHFVRGTKKCQFHTRSFPRTSAGYNALSSRLWSWALTAQRHGFRPSYHSLSENRQGVQ